MENCEREFFREFGIESDAGFDEWFERDFAFHRDQGAEALACDFKDGICDFLDRFALFESRSEERMAAKIGERTAKFRLKDDDQSDRQKDRQASKDPADDGKIEKLGEEGEGQEEKRESDENARAMGAAQVDVDVIENRRENADLDRDAPIFRDKFCDGLEH